MSFNDWIQFGCHSHLINCLSFLMEWLTFARVEDKVVLISINLNTIVHAAAGSTVIVGSEVSSLSGIGATWGAGDKCVKSLFEGVVINGETELTVFWIFFVLWHNWASRH